MMIPLPKSITSERIVIRPFKPDDFDAYLAFTTDEEATRHLMFTDEQRMEEGARAIPIELVTRRWNGCSRRCPVDT